jgi:tetratricopeptide (TPR) repeat protein
MIAGIKNAQELIQAERYQPAKDLLLKLSRDADWAGIESGHLWWGLAIASDYLGQLEEAFGYVSKAIRADPLSPAYDNSFGIILGRMKAALANPEGDPDDATLPRLYKALVRAGKADEGCHLAMAKWLDQADKAEDALKVLDALTTLAPASRDAWVAKAAILKKLGRTTLAVSAESEAENCGTIGGTPFATLPAAQA